MKNPLAFLLRQVGRFADDRRGGVAIFVAAALIPLIGALGLATDVSRSYLVKSRLQDAVDAAALAGGRVIASASRDTDIQSFFRVNFPVGFMDSEDPDHPGQDPVAIITDNHVGAQAATTVTVTARARIPTTLMRVLGFQTITVAATATATKEVSALDVVLAMDVSGSMGMPMTKMTDAKTAATNLVSYLFNGASTSPTLVVGGTTYRLLNIGMVPWNHQVNVTRNGVAFNGTVTTATVPAFTNPMTGQVGQTTIYYANNSPVPLLNNPRIYDSSGSTIATWSGSVYMRYTADGNNANDGDFVLDLTTVGGASWQGYLAANDYWSKDRTGNWSTLPCVSGDGGGNNGVLYCVSRSGGTAYSGAGTAASAFDANTGTNTSAGVNGWVGWGLSSGTAVYRVVAIRHNTTTTLHLQFQTDSSSTFGSPTTVATQNVSVTAGTWKYVKLPPYTGERYFRIKENGGSTLRPQELVFSPNGPTWDGEERKCYLAYWQSNQVANSDTPGELGDEPPSLYQYDYPSGTDSTIINTDNNYECEDPPAQGITDLTYTKATIDTAISQLSPGGHTDIPAGLYWAWEVVTPGGPYTAAVASPPFPRAQAIVLFTDGENQAMFGDAYRMSFGYDTAGATATGFGYLPTPPAPDATTYNNLNNRLVAMATAIKGDGVRIYVVKYQHADATTTALLQQVASGSAAPFYFDAANAADLEDAFQQIAADLSKLRLSK